MGLGGQFLLLLWKNWTVSRRRICATVFEIVLPIAFALLMLAIRNLVEVTDHPDPTSYDPFEVDNLHLYIPQSRRNILYTPNATKINTIMGSLQSSLGSNATVTPYDSIAAIDKYLETNKDGVWAVVAFDSGLDYSSGLPLQTKYTLRVARMQSRDRWRTNQQYPFFQNPGPRNNDSDGGNPNYLSTGFLSLQYAINKAIIDEHNPSNNLSAITLSLKKMAYPPFVDDALLTVLQSTLPLFLVLAYIVTVFQTTKNIVIEKETRLKESMKLMGLNPTIYWLSWFTKVLIYLIITCLVFTIIFAVKIGGNSVLNKSDPSLIFVFLLLFGISIAFFCFMMSAIFQTANSAAYAAGVIYYMFFVPNYFLSDQYETLSTTAKLLTCLLNNMSMTFGVISITLYEGTGEGAKWSNFYEPATVEDNFSLLHAMMMFVIDSVIYGMIAWYLENVRPGEYGVPRPLYFPFTSDYWCGPKKYREMNDIAAQNDSSDTFEEEPTHLPVGVSIIHLRKEFGRGKNKKIAVADTSLNMYEGQITVLLGHNGAGKTTTMSMLTGFIPPTKGTAYLNNCDIRKNIDGVRKSLGLCPQHNILYDVLTVEEHLEFFAKLKNIPNNKIKEEVTNTLKTLGIESKRRNYSSSLSGGQKRKLSVGISLIGDAKVIILDEPTSGMDPAARRETWDILQKYKDGRTIVLTTHFMDEADLLGDRIAIMAEGVVKCCGTSLFLKKRYGAGYHLVAVKTKDCNVSKVTEVIKSHVPRAILESEISAELSYLLPFDESKKFENLFDEIEKRSTELGLSSFGTTATTMEEVFLKVGEGAKTEDDEDDDVGNDDDKKRIIDGLSNPSFTDNNDTNTVEMRAMGDSAAAFNSNITKNKGFALSFQQFYGMFVKKAIHTWRNRVVTLVQLILPVIYAVFALLTEATTPTSEDEPSLLLDVSQFDNSPIITYGAGKAAATSFTTGAASIFKDNFASYSTKDFDASSYSTMDDYFVAKAKEIGVSTFRNKYIISGEFSTDTTFTAHFNGEAFHTPAVALGHMMNTLLQMYTNSSLSIATTNYPMKLALSEKTVSTRALAMGFTVAFLVLFGMAFLTTSFILFLIKERQTGAKHLQKVSGVSSFAYWLSNYCWDLINYCIPVLCILVVFAAFESPAYVEDSRLGIVFLVFFVYGMCCLPFMYALHFLFSVPATGMVTITMLNIATGLAALLTVFLLNIPSFGTEDIANILDWVFTILFPHYCLGQSLSDMYTNYDTIKSCEAVNYKTLCEVFPTFSCCSGCTDNCYKFDENYLAWEKPGILRNIVFMLIQACVYFLLVFFIEVGAINRIGYALSGRKPKSTFRQSMVDVQEENSIEGSGQEDSDVKAERLRIDQSAVTSLMDTDALVLKNLGKTYGSYHAVKGISVGVAKQECFGLLGQNGAGKTTTFKMLTGDVFVSHGNAYLNVFDVKHSLRQVQQNLGYCPQFDALIDQMTGRETLTMYARLRGVHEKQIPKVVDNLIDALMLKKYATKNCANYSGGNKRKLSTAIALIGDPPFVLLDEPTTGMDPGARRKLWNVLSAVRASGRTLVLTSHSMEECDALCTKIVIMVNGKFVCLGSPQHLKNKFGHGYTLIMRLGSEKDGVVVAPEPIKNFIKETFPDSEIFDDHKGYIHFQIPDSNVPLARVFGAMENAKGQFDIADYSVHQTTLEQVFLTFTRNQIQPKEKKKRKCMSCCC